MKNTRSTIRLFVGVLLLALVATACTKKKELKTEIDSAAYLDKSEFVGTNFVSGQGNKVYHLSRGVEEASSLNEFWAVPGFSEDFGLVTVRITEKELQLLSHFNPRGRPETATPIATFPIVDHFDIKRETNDFGDQTNRIVEDRKKPWSERKFMRVDWSRPSNSMSQFLNAIYSRLGLGNEEGHTLLETPALDKTGHFSFLAEVVLASSFSQEGASRVTYRTHLTPFKDADFVPVQYSLKDFERFGYFFTQQEFNDPQKGLMDAGVKRYANVFNICEAKLNLPCSTNKIEWVLSKGFPEKYKGVTRQAIREWNETFQEALGRSDEVIVLNESVQADISDPTQHVIAYYPHETQAGLLGVAQSVTDPRTGRVVAARSTIYEDGIQGMMGYVDDVIEILASKDPIADIVKTNALKGTQTEMVSPFGGAKTGAHMKMMRKVLGMDTIKNSAGLARNPFEVIRTAKPRFTGASLESSTRMKNLAEKKPGIAVGSEHAIFQNHLKQVSHVASQRAIQTAKQKATSHNPFGRKQSKSIELFNAPELGGAEALLFAAEEIKAKRAHDMDLAEHGIHGAELVEEAASRYLLKLLKTQTPAQMKSAKEQIKEEIAKQTFYTTLLHELGHNFGLRHNFNGSADKANYMPQHAQLKKAMEKDKTVTEDDLLPYAFSSIMDYGGDFYSQVGGLGPYDRAAIKYAYNRSGDRDAMATVEVNGKKKNKFMFCTDHQVGETITCRRFDKGSNVSEVTLETVNTFNRNWPLSHFRRGRADFGWRRGANPGSMLFNVFLPTRQVLDEFIYSFVTAKQVDAATKKANPATTGRLCDMEFVHVSVKNGELGNVCTPTAMEAAGVDPTDLETLYNALINPETGAPYKKPSEYVAYGLADLLFANLSAQQFFQNTIGATEPGTYLALPPQQQGEPFQLVRLDQDQPTDEDKLKAFAEENGIPNPDQFVKQAKNLLTDVKIGGAGRPFNTATSSTAGETQLETIGSFWDKRMAILALGFRDLGVQKYSESSMIGNAYVFPQTQKFATALFNSLITGNSKITLVPVELRMRDPQNPNQGVVVPAVAEATLNQDTQAIATLVGFGLLASDNNTSFIDKLRICNKNEGQCAEGVGGEVVEFRSAAGGDVFRAAQTALNDSIGFNLVKEAKAISDERQKWIDIGKKAGELQAENLLKLDAAGELRERIEENLGKIEELKKLQDQITKVDPKAPSAWSMLVLLTEKINEAPLFFAIDLAQKIGGAFQNAGVLVDNELKKMGTKGVCEAPKPVPAASAGSSATITIGDSSGTMKAIMLARAQGKMGNFEAVLANMMPPSAAPAAPAVDAECAKSPEHQRRQTLEALKADFKEVTALVGAVLQANINQKAAPLQVRRQTSELESKEGFVRIIRSLSEMSGGL